MVDRHSLSYNSSKVLNTENKMYNVILSSQENIICLFSFIVYFASTTPGLPCQALRGWGGGVGGAQPLRLAELGGTVRNAFQHIAQGTSWLHNPQSPASNEGSTCSRFAASGSGTHHRPDIKHCFRKATLHKEGTAASGSVQTVSISP